MEGWCRLGIINLLRKFAAVGRTIIVCTSLSLITATRLVMSHFMLHMEYLV